MASFQLAFNYTIGNEGTVYTDRPHDAGGPTKYGITLATLSAFKQSSVTIDQIKNLTLIEAEEIYEKMFWLPVGLDKVLDQRVAMALFDMGVNLGPVHAVKLFQASTGIPNPDGIIGPNTLTRINTKHTGTLIESYVAELASYYRSIVQHNPTQRVFLQGWLSRARKLLTLAV